VPNKFPAVNAMLDGLGVAELDGMESSSQRINLFERRELFGAHEVIIESPQHVQSITSLDSESTDLVFQAYRDRLRHWLEDRRCAYAVVFKNVGKDAGASLAHTHSQLIATDVIPTDIKRTADRMQLFHEKESECLHCRMVRDELENESRIVEETPDFVAFCPFASRVPSLLTIVPKSHQARFEMLDPFAIKQLSWLTHRLIRRIEKRYPEAAYNFIIHTAPRCLQDSDFFHWRLELFPRLTKVAGFEWGSDCFINPLAPEDAAHGLRSAGV
jgi:UDPglucose--hexose-1-phosphate uridylyltransferase